MPESLPAQLGRIVIAGGNTEYGLPVWRMPEGVSIEFPEGHCRVIRGRHGWFLYHPGDIYLGKAIETYGECCELEIALYRSFLTEGGVLIEVGANAGYLTVPLARLVGTSGRLVAFEPQPAIHRLLCANAVLNGLSWVSCVHAAVGATDGVVSVPDLDAARPGNLGGVSLTDRPMGGGKTAQVPLMTLDSYCGGLDRLDVIKIDVEGMESDVLAGARRLLERFRPVLVVENDRTERSRALVELLQSLDYRCYWHIQPLYNPENHFRQPRNIYPRISSFNMLCVHARSTQPTNLLAVDPCTHPLDRLP